MSCNKRLVVLLGLGLAYFVTGAVGDATEKCEARNASYFISDSAQCDKYYECGKAGKMTERLCEDGFVFSEAIRQCDYPHNADCSKRALLQPSQSNDKNCERSNGFYAFPPSISCQKFYHCLEGVAYEKTCPEGIVFDPTKATCMHPDLANRAECAAHSVLNFKCPNMNERFTKLRFGDHDRHAHPSDCRKFFICLQDGKPRLGGCPIGKVFNPKTGFCDSPKNVAVCKDYYGKKLNNLSVYDIEALEKMGEEGFDMDIEGSSADKKMDAQDKAKMEKQPSKEKDAPKANLL